MININSIIYLSEKYKCLITYFHSAFIFRCAFFQGQVEQPVRGLTSLLTHQDVPVLVGINPQGVFVIDNVQCVSIYYLLESSITNSNNFLIFS